ncbi:MAG: hypothetical protein P8163_21065 [Candidatus Thiodiazotropha sp.]
MNKRTLIHFFSLLLLALIIALQGCGGGGGGGDDTPEHTETDENTTDPDQTETDENTTDPDQTDADENDTNADSSLRSNVWMTASCVQDDNGIYTKSLIKFSTEGTIYFGYQDFQDTSCVVPKAETYHPDLDVGTFTTGESRILQDGANGTSISFMLNDGQIDAAFTVTNQNTLCFTSNVSVNTPGIQNMRGSTEQVDYDNCLTVFSSTDTPDPNPNPNPNPNPDPDPVTTSSNLQGKWLNVKSCEPSSDGSYMKVAYMFTEDNRVLIAGVPYDNSRCEGEMRAASDYLEPSTPITYVDQGEATLPDGTQGYSLRLSFGSDYADGFYTFDAENRLCISYNLGLTYYLDKASTNINYDNCMTSLGTQ